MSARPILAVLLAAVAWSGAVVAAELALVLSPEPMTPAPGRFAWSGGPEGKQGGGGRPVSTVRPLRSMADDPAGCVRGRVDSWVCNATAAQRIAGLSSAFGGIGDEWSLRTGDGLLGAQDGDSIPSPAAIRR